MNKKTDWHMKGGRLVNGEESLGVDEVYERQKDDPEIREACRLKPYRPDRDVLNAAIIAQLAREEAEAKAQFKEVALLLIEHFENMSDPEKCSMPIETDKGCYIIEIRKTI